MAANLDYTVNTTSSGAPTTNVVIQNPWVGGTASPVFVIENAIAVNNNPFLWPDFNEILGPFVQDLNVALGNFNRIGQPYMETTPEVLASARRLLVGILPAEDVLRLDRDGYVPIPSRKHPGRTYRIDKWGSVSVYQNGERYANVCIHVGGLMFVNDDSVVAMWLIARFAEEEIEEVGHWTYACEAYGLPPPIGPLKPDIVIEG